MKKRMEPVTGIEPALPAWKAGALPLSYTDVGAQGEVSTSPQDFPSFRAARTTEKKGEIMPRGSLLPGGATRRTRTADPLITNQPLYQLKL